MRNYATFLGREWVADRCSYYSSGLGLRLKRLKASNGLSLAEQSEQGKSNKTIVLTPNRLEQDALCVTENRLPEEKNPSSKKRAGVRPALHRCYGGCESGP